MKTMFPYPDEKPLPVRGGPQWHFHWTRWALRFIHEPMPDYPDTFMHIIIIGPVTLSWWSSK